MKRLRLTPMKWLAVVTLSALATACASIGRPQGGPRDEEPPIFVSANPAMGALNVSRQQIDLYFDENVQLQDAFNKVIVSPVQKNTPRATANGRHVRVQLQDSLLPNTTYTIDFADAIKDLNEGNILDGFATYFSTGETIDSLSISGMVLEARTLEPAQGMLVGVYSNLSDTAITTLPLERVARTNQYGQFTILNLKPGNYRVYAINDDDRNYFRGPTEDVAFYDMIVSPTVQEITVTDTLRSASNEDSLVTRQGIAYLPNDILLTWFNEGKKKQYLSDYKRESRRKFTLTMGAPADSLPEITIAKGPFEGLDIKQWAVMEVNPTQDSLVYWIRDPEVLAIDSLYLSVKHRASVDTIPEPFWKTDTLKFFYSEPKKKKKKNEEADTVPPQTTFMNLRAVTNQVHDVYMPLILNTDQPIDTIDTNGVLLEMAQDTVWVTIKDAVLTVDTISPVLNRRIYYQWQPGAKYRLTIDSAAVKGIYDEWNDAFKHEFTVKNLDEYSNLIFNITPADSAMVVELLDKSDKVIRTVPVIDGKATIKYINPGVVYARLFIDSNRNGEWDTGSLADSIQPEEVYYFPKKINLKKNWDVTMEWNIYDLPIDKQKPNDIKKNKPKLKKGERQQTQDEEEEEDEFDSPFGDYNNTYNNSRRNNSRSSNRNTNALGTSPRMR